MSHRAVGWDRRRQSDPLRAEDVARSAYLEHDRSLGRSSLDSFEIASRLETPMGAPIRRRSNLPTCCRLEVSDTAGCPAFARRARRDAPYLVLLGKPPSFARQNRFLALINHHLDEQNRS